MRVPHELLLKLALCTVGRWKRYNVSVGQIRHCVCWCYCTAFILSMYFSI